MNRSGAEPLPVGKSPLFGIDLRLRRRWTGLVQTFRGFTRIQGRLARLNRGRRRFLVSVLIDDVRVVSKMRNHNSWKPCMYYSYPYATVS